MKHLEYWKVNGSSSTDSSYEHYSMGFEVAGGCLNADDQKRIRSMGLGPRKSLSVDCVSLKCYAELKLSE